MRGILLDHTSPNMAQSFRAELDENGRKIDITFRDGKKSVIEISDKDAPIDLICPSEDGLIMWCSLKNGVERFFETLTGVPFVPTNIMSDKLGCMPKFYS